MAGLLRRLVDHFSGSSVAPPEQQFHDGSALDYEKLARLLSSHPDYRVLKAIYAKAGVERLRTPAPGERVAAVVDTETTGLDLSADTIIEVAIQRFTFDAGHHIIEIEQPQYWLEDPQRPLPESIARLTGITDPDLKGQRFDDDAIVAMIGGADIVIAHNAAFDRPFLDRRFPEIDSAPWACSLSQVDWRSLGFDGRALGHLLLQSGRFFDGHRAGNDTNALATLLGTSAGDGRTILAHLLESCERGAVRIEATGAPFEAKDALKARRYRWNAVRRAWWREMDSAEATAERTWLDQNVYLGRGGPQLVEVNPKNRFKRDEADR